MPPDRPTRSGAGYLRNPVIPRAFESPFRVKFMLGCGSVTRLWITRPRVSISQKGRARVLAHPQAARCFATHASDLCCRHATLNSLSVGERAHIILQLFVIYGAGTCCLYLDQETRPSNRLWCSWVLFPPVDGLRNQPFTSCCCAALFSLGHLCKDFMF